ncbi:DUF4030 domain-containing protein [Bacillus sp. BHET2]|uniref:DUF4030 domain-containing protein n=1 Tax=Bacillus sp. BHET2 TaxID=2583818 RepID=UPI0014871B1A|nr:DUF4030 domain-containing protein [Bacillus sp. BHET2]
MNDLSNKVKKEIEAIHIPEERLTFSIEQAIKKGKRHRKKVREKWTYVCSAAVVLIGMFLSSGTVSPAMAKVVSKIPIIGEILYSDEGILEAISESLQREGYDVNKINLTITQEKEIIIGIRGQIPQYEMIKEKVGGIVSNVLESKGYDAYTWKVVRKQEEKIPVKDEQVQRRSREFQLIDSETRKEASKRNIKISSIFQFENPKSIVVEIPKTEERTNEIKRIVNDVMATNQLTEIPIKIKKVSVSKKKQEGRWSQVLMPIHHDLMGKEEYKVKTVGFTVHPSPQILVSLTISSKDVEAEEFAQQLELRIDEVLKSEKMKALVQDDSYQILIKSKEGNEIN